MLETVTYVDSNQQVQMADPYLRMDDITPKGVPSVLQPKPRRLLPVQSKSGPPDRTRFVDLRKSSSLSEESFIVGCLPSDDSGNCSELSPSTSPPMVSSHSSVHPAQEMSEVLDLSAKRPTPFSVLDLLGKPDTNRAGLPVPMFPQGTSLPTMPPILYPAYASGIFQQKLPNITRQQEVYKQQTEDDTSPQDTRRRKISSGRRRASLTSSPESQRSDSFISDPCGSDPNSSTENSPKFCDTRLDKKSNRTNYTPQQVRQLEKVFLETPYPEHEVYEQLSKELSIPEPRLKVWFQNKRARWKRRAEDKMTYTSGYHIPMMPMGYQYGMFPGSVTSTPESSNVSRSHVMYQGGAFPCSLYPYQAAQMYVHP